MKRKLIITAIFLLGSLGVFSQSKLTEEQKQEFETQLETYKVSLNLNEEQASKMEEINLLYFEGLASLKSSNDPKLAKYQKFKNLSQERDFSVKILTPEQYKIFMQQQKKIKKEIRKRKR